jgi:hypothetical protein
MLKMLYILFFALSLPLPAQQLDKPVGPEDLADRKADAEKHYAAESAGIDDTERAMRVLVGPDTHSPNAEGAAAQILILRCVSDRGYFSGLAQIYAAANLAAGKIVSDLEARIDSAAAFAQAIQQLQRQLDATLRREAELQASADPAAAVDLDNQRQIEKNLRQAIKLYQSIPPAEYSTQAERMHALETNFAFLGQDANDQMKIAEDKCSALRQFLVYLAQQEKQVEQLKAWSQLLPNPSTPDRPTKQHGHSPFSASAPQQETTQ